MFVCNIKKLFEIHLTTHRDVDSFKCMDCNTEHDSALTLVKHICTSHSPRRLVPPCPFCSKDFVKLGELNNHIRNHHSRTCPACFDTFNDEKEVKFGCHECKPMDISKHTLPNATCHKCRVFFPDKNLLPEHLENCQQFKCHICQRCLNTQSTLRVHLSRHKQESSPDVHSCDRCAQTFTTRYKLMAHIHAQHEPGIPCTICKKAFPTQTQLTQHMNTHTRPFICSICGLNFSDKKMQKNHELGHSGQNPNTCHICNRSFLEKSKLKKHLITHTDTKNYKCRFCNKLFQLQSVWKRHEQNVHAKSCDFHCKELGCEKEFKSKESLRQHVQVVHRKGANQKHCTVCDMVFTTGQMLRKHLARAHGVNTQDLTNRLAEVPIEGESLVAPVTQQANEAIPVAQHTPEPPLDAAQPVAPSFVGTETPNVAPPVFNPRSPIPSHLQSYVIETPTQVTTSTGSYSVLLQSTLLQAPTPVTHPYQYFSQ